MNVLVLLLYAMSAEECSHGDGVTILSIDASTADRSTLRTICRTQTWKLWETATYRDGVRALIRFRPRLILCDDRLPDGDWMDVLGQIADCTDPPTLIVTSALADERLWSEVLHMGACDLLAKPFHEPEVVHAVRSACRVWPQAAKAQAAGSTV
jgi:DNA-binding response OmpR family regulator